MNTHPLLAALLLLTLPGCESLPTAASGGDIPLAKVAGIWLWSHAGNPTIQSADIDVAAILDENMADSKLSISPDGSTSMIVVGQSRSLHVEAREVTPLFIKLGSPDNPDFSLTYDKATKLLALPMPLEIEDAKGTITAYYKRKR